MDMPFIGKWSLTTAAGHAVYAEASTGRLMVGASPTPAQARFNAYGTASDCVLQASGGSYVVATTGSTFAATALRDGSLARFTVVAGAGSFVTIGWLDGGVAQGWWSDAPGPLTAGAAPGSSFTQTIVTPGLASLAPQPGMDLTWVYLAGQDLGPLLQLNAVDLTGADLAGANLAGVAMNRTILSGADMTAANMTGLTDLSNAVLVATNLTQARLSDAQLNGIQAQKAIFTDVVARGASLNDANLQEAKLIRTDLSGFASSVVNTDFTGADLSGADFTLASVRKLTIVDANLTNVKLSNTADKRYVDLSDAKLSAKTNLTGAKLQYVDISAHDLSQVVMTRADLTQSKLDRTKLVGAEMSYITLTGASLTGNIPMFGANLSNATMTGANLSGAQMGSISVVFRLTNDATQGQKYKDYLSALQRSDAAGVMKTFAENGVTLTPPVYVIASPSAPDRVWTVNAQVAYTVRLETDNAGLSSLATYQPESAAILVNAYMKDVILTSANLYNVSASGVQLYGQALLDGQAILEGARFDGANLSGLNLKKAATYGVSFSHATLTGAQLDGAALTPSSAGAQASFANANLQGTSFKDAALAGAIFTDAAVAVAGADGKNQGVWLFSSGPDDGVAPQLTAATQQFALAIELAPQLTQGPVTAPIVKAFKANGVTLSDSALVIVQAQGPLWTIVDGATTYRVFQGCDQDEFVPALGVSKTAVLKPIFAIPLYLQKELNRGGAVSPAVARAFADAGYPLAAGAQVSVGTMPTDWQLVDPVAGSFDLWQGLNLDCTLAITVRPSMPGVIDLYAGHSLPLTRRATVAAGATGKWLVDNDSNNPFNAVTNYIKFNVVTETSGELGIYGSLLRVQQVGPDGAVFRNVQISLTALTQDQLQPSTVCPNSARTQTNIAAGLPFDEWMRARELPKPPFCVPSADGAFYCPPAGPV